jgi:hypothetical protein
MNAAIAPNTHVPMVPHKAMVSLELEPATLPAAI